MSDENVRTFVFPESASGKSFDPNLLLGMNGGCGGGMWNNPIWALVFLAFLGNNGLGFGGNGNSCATNGQLNAIREQLSDNQNSTLLMDAIKGNSQSLTTLASNLNLNTNAVTSAINGVQAQIAQIGANQGMNALQVVNAINAGNASLASQLSQCCCENKQLVTTLGYETQLRDLQNTGNIMGRVDTLATNLASGLASMGYATREQTCDLQNTYNAGVQKITDKLSQMQTDTLMDKLNASKTEVATLKAQIDNSQQTATFAAMLAPIQAELASIKSKQPNTVPVQYPNIVGVPASQIYGYGYNGGSIWS